MQEMSDSSDLETSCVHPSARQIFPVLFLRFSEPCRLVGRSQCFGETNCFHLQDSVSIHWHFKHLSSFVQTVCRDVKQTQCVMKGLDNVFTLIQIDPVRTLVCIPANLQGNQFISNSEWLSIWHYEILFTDLFSVGGWSIIGVGLRTGWRPRLNEVPNFLRWVGVR